MAAVGSRYDHALSRRLQNSVCYLELFSSIDHHDETTQVKVSQSPQFPRPGSSPRFL